MAQKVEYPVVIYPPGGNGAVLNNNSYYGIDQPILVLKAKMTGPVNFTITTDALKVSEVPYNNICQPLLPTLVAFSNRPGTFTQEIGEYYYGTTVTITNTGTNVVIVKSPDFDAEVPAGGTHSFGISGDWAYSEPRVVKLWKTTQNARLSCSSNFTTEDKRPNNSIRIYEFEVTEITNLKENSASDSDSDSGYDSGYDSDSGSDN